MDLTGLKKKIEEQFVEDYEDLLLFMNQINDVLKKFNINSKYKNYNTFCLDVEDHIIDYYTMYGDSEISPEIMSNVLNNMIKIKILEDPEHEKKLNDFFNNDNSFDEIKDLKNILKKK